MAQLSNQDDFIKTALRLPRDLHAAVQNSAAKLNRSMNAEIIARLESSFQAEKLGLRGDLLEAMAMQSMLICVLYATIDKSRLSDPERQMFETIVRHAQKVTDNTLFSDDPNGPPVIVGQLPPGVLVGTKDDLQKP
ncbi:Arc family DNA-binding protein [Dechloromonas denitrificans]|uniref:Arc family DNA-binding protein n=1 Tax=Dechloromonas denitrificans TaxID=281362 RepID=UPI001CF8831A|nr:Arc family DNA-binding protein [Dechloromonas denitrificans]UCV02319.1 Arc family DNA-binding protein [Dechloromonas denitrificans]